MAKEFKLGALFGLDISLTPSFYLVTFLLWAVLSALGILALDMGISQALLTGLVATLSHWLASLVHNLGHAVAARGTGYPMVGIRLGVKFLLSASIYPKDEIQLPAEVHIRRALGGPVGGLVFSIAVGMTALVLRSLDGVYWWPAFFGFLSGFLVYTLGPFLPLGFTDGSTLLRWWGKR